MTEKASLANKEDTVVAEEAQEVTDVLDPEYEKLLQTDPSKGLTDKQVAERLEKFGPNGNSW